MKKILLVATGGTIASKRTMSGLRPLITSQEIMGYIPQVKDFCIVDTIQICNIDSTDATPQLWCIIAETVEENYEQYDGFVITHGTDTLAYTAAGLSYLVQNSKKPIVITGSQKSVDMDITDAKTNLLDSFLYASDDESQGVVLIFDGKVIAGTRAKKVRSKSNNAFSSIDFPYLAVIQDLKIMRYIPMIPYEEDVKFYYCLNEKVFLLKLIPGMRPEILTFAFAQYDCIILESFGVGGIPSSIKAEFYRLYEENPQKIMVMATQVSHEGSDMTVYEVGQEVKKDCNIMESYDMTLESVVAKCMWLLGQGFSEIEELQKQFYTIINYDMVFSK